MSKQIVFLSWLCKVDREVALGGNCFDSVSFSKGIFNFMRPLVNMLEGKFSIWIFQHKDS